MGNLLVIWLASLLVLCFAFLQDAVGKAMRMIQHLHPRTVMKTGMECDSQLMLNKMRFK